MFGKEECVPCLVLLSVWAKPWEPLCLLDFLQEVNTLCLPEHFASLRLGAAVFRKQMVGSSTDIFKYPDDESAAACLVWWCWRLAPWGARHWVIIHPPLPPSHLAFDILQLSAIRSQCLELPTGCRIWFMDATITPTAPMHRCLFQIFFSILLQFCWK